MLIAFAGASGRTDASHAALIAARAAVALEGRALLLAGGDLHEGRGPQGIVRLAAATSEGLVRAARACRREGGVAFADVPSTWLRDAPVRDAFDATILVVGPHELDERAAAAWSAGIEGSAPPTYLGCRRAGGGPAATRFAEAMSALDPGARVIPYALPPIGRGEAKALDGTIREDRALHAGLLLLAAIRPVAGFAPGGPAPGEEAGGREDGAFAADTRTLPDRLRDLADDVEAVAAGLAPTAEDLARAPVLDAWEPDVAVAPILKGIATGHPNVADGRPVRTAEIFLTDRATWARSLSRWWVLRAPAGSDAANLQ